MLTERTENPLLTRFWFTPDEIEIYRLRLRVDLLEQEIDKMVADARAGKEIDDTINTSNIQLRAEFKLGSVVGTLRNTQHSGSCVMVLGACARCDAERLFGLKSTLPEDISPRHRHSIFYAFRRGRLTDVPATDALAKLRNGTGYDAEAADILEKHLLSFRGYDE